MQIDLRYGRGSMPLTLPDDADVTVVRKPPMPLLEDEAASVERALDEPVGVQPLAELARGANTACIAICDITRPVPNHLFLRPMIERLLAAGVPQNGITVLVLSLIHI